LTGFFENEVNLAKIIELSKPNTMPINNEKNPRRQKFHEIATGVLMSIVG